MQPHPVTGAGARRQDMIARTRRSAATLLFVHALLAPACSAGSDPDAPSRRRRGILSGPPVAAPEARPAAAPPPLAPTPPPPRPPPPPAAPAAAPAEEPEPRDYAAELLQGLGSPIDCLAPRAGSVAPPKLRIDFDAYVMPSGGVGRAYARSADLEASELACLRRRVEGLRLAPPIEGAPREVHASLQLELKPAEAKPK